jgi:iron-sulfur cluster repair protein YtfE (RIC family)
MGFAAAGYLPPVAGAIAQEGIDLIAILNALRALGGYEPRRESDALREQLSQRFREEHGSLVPQLKMIRLVADRLDSLSPQEALEELKRVHRFLTEDLVPHELAEEKDLYPVMAKFLGGEDPVGPMIRAHAEISHLTRVLGQLIEDLPPEGPGPEDLSELRRVLYGLYAILDLHFAQEEEAYLSRAETGPARMA